VPSHLQNLVHFWSNADKDDIAKRKFQSTLVELVEKTFGKSLDNYISDVYTYWSDNLWWQWTGNSKLPTPSWQQQQNQWFNRILNALM